jgi:signal transduction histidine kinase
MTPPTNLQALSSGFETLDSILEGPQWGDTVVFHLSSPEEYYPFLELVSNFLKAQNIPLHYFAFSEKSVSFVTGLPRLIIHNLSCIQNLERLSEELSQVFAQNDSATFYIFDNVSELIRMASAEKELVILLQKISTELAERQAAAYVALGRNLLSNATVAEIRDAVPVFLDIQSVDNALYFQPIKVQGRYSAHMFKRYRILEGDVQPESALDFEDYARTLEKKSKEFLELYAQKRDVEKDLKKKVFELSLVNDITSSLLSTMNLDEILFRILVGVTAQEGLGFNRAFLLLVNDQEKMLEGKMAIGPSSLEEALRIWTDLNTRPLTFRELLASFDEEWQQRDIYVNQIVRKIRIPLSDRSHLLIDLLTHMQPEIIGYEIPSHRHPEEILKLLEVHSFAAVPLLFRKRSLGLLLADNLITQRDITIDDVEMLETFANYASAALEHARLYEEVRTRIKESERHIHELEAMQNRLIRSKKLSELGELASKMAHEIRTPLVSIGGFANAMLKSQAPDAPNSEYLKIIVEEVRRLEAIISDVLAYVSPGIPRTKPVDLKGILDQVVFLMEVPLREKKIRAYSNYPADLSPIHVDPDQMKQVFMAIISNAIESMSEGGVLALAIHCHNDFVRISISDTGTGISEDKRDKVFDAFFTTKSTGSGLGLNIASQIITNHNGSIYVESQVGMGSTFIINLPVSLLEEALPCRNS